MVNRRKYQRMALFLTMALALLLTACGGKDTAASMRLVKTDGTVQVDDEEGKSVKITENLGLYSGYDLTTKTESYGWINLDDTKLVKMDEESDVEINWFLKATALPSITVAAFHTKNTPDFVTDALNHPEYWPSSGNPVSDTDENGDSVADGMNMSDGSAPDPEQWATEGNKQENYDIGAQTAPMTQDVEAALEQYRTIVSQADTYEYESWTPRHEYQYTLFQEEGCSIPTLILKSLDNDRTGFLLFRYDPENQTASQIGSDYTTRFEMPKHEFINGIPWDSWYDFTDSSGLDAWEP